MPVKYAWFALVAGLLAAPAHADHPHRNIRDAHEDVRDLREDRAMALPPSPSTH